jgi:16S rRNA (guanine966-N2)-methyltransferase
MRVIAGTFRSRILKSPKDLALRPTSDMLRETLFNVLGPRVANSRFVDAFAGTGAVGIEAMSRGASEVIFLENHRPTAGLIKKNLELLEVRSGTRILTADALRGLQWLEAEFKPGSMAVDIVFLDPPYAAAADYQKVLSFLGSAKFLGSGSLVIAEHRHTFGLPEIIGELQQVRVLRQGEASLSFYRFGLSEPMKE